MGRHISVVGVLAGLALATGCDSRSSRLDAGPSTDAGIGDTGTGRDGGEGDSGRSGLDGGSVRDAGLRDAGAGGDAGPSIDAGAVDAAPRDAGGADSGSTPTDAGAPRIDAGPPSGGCISGASGAHVARFRWEGSGPGSTAYVVYEANTLPDRSRWRAGAYSRGAIGSYTPRFVDTYLGEGGLELGSTNFIDVELSTAGLGAVSNVTIAIFGRSYSTGSSGSFRWMSFDGSGASPYGGVANSAPYEWYGADATDALPAGNDGALLRIEAEGPSGSLVVRRVEICFDAI